MIKRVFLIVLDSLGIGELPDAKDFNDVGSNTLRAISSDENFHAENLTRLGLFNIDGVKDNAFSKSLKSDEKFLPIGSYAKMTEQSKGKDTTCGHWEIAGLIKDTPLPTYPDGFPKEIIDEFEKKTGKKVLCNKPYSGTDVIKDYGEEHLKSNSLIVYTSADSVFQIASHTSVVSEEELYKYCLIAREMLVGKHGVGRVIARPFDGEYPFKRTSGRHDYSIIPPKKTMLDILSENGFDVISVGKIYDIFAGKGIAKTYKTVSNDDGMNRTFELQKTDFNGICFVNLVDFDTVYGHRNDISGYATAITQFDKQLKVFIENMRKEDVLIITADHGCDPSTISTDHSREYTPMLIYGDEIKNGVNLGVRNSFSDIAQTILEIFKVNGDEIDGESFYQKIKK